MADKAKVRRVKKVETVRERAARTPVQTQKRSRRVAAKAASPFKAFGRFLGHVLRPLRFLLWPFKTKPMRLLGRILSSILFLRFFRSAWKEVRTVTWPDRRQTWNLTFAVFMFALVFGLIISLVDLGLNKIFRALLLK